MGSQLWILHLEMICGLESEAEAPAVQGDRTALIIDSQS